jgi:thioester reductase-like protein
MSGGKGILVTGGTGFLGAYALVGLAARTEAPLFVLTRASSRAEAADKLWKSLQVHLDFDAFRQLFRRLEIVGGDLVAPDLGLSAARWDEVARRADSVLHIAASLNRKSEKACLNTNLRGTLSVVRLARAMAEAHGLRRFTYVSTVAVAGERSHEVVEEDEAVDWGRSDYDPYGRTKKFAEHMVAELLPPRSWVVLRPSIVLGDSRRAEVTQFDMTRAFCALADLPVVPLPGSTRLDVVPADYVGEAMVHLHLAERPAHARYHLSAGRDAPTAQAIGEVLSRRLGRPLRFAPGLGKSFELAFRTANRWPRRDGLQAVGALMKVFWPYITYDTVFANERVVGELGRKPTSFLETCVPLYQFARQVQFRYPYRALPEVP